MKVTQKLIIEASAVGLGLVLLWYLFNMLSEKVSKKDNLIISLFIVGASFHLIAEFTGMNQWYCRNGNACTV